MLMLGTDDRVIPGNEKPACGDIELTDATK